MSEKFDLAVESMYACDGVRVTNMTGKCVSIEKTEEAQHAEELGQYDHSYTVWKVVNPEGQRHTHEGEYRDGTDAMRKAFEILGIEGDDFEYSKMPMQPERDVIVKIPIDELHAHPRNFFRTLDDEELAELANSIDQLGLQHPVAVTPRKGGGYTIISGHQRTNAMRLFEAEEVPCVIREYASEEDAELALIHANTKTRNLSPMEMARSIRREKQIFGNRRGQRTDLKTYGDNRLKLEGATRDIVADAYGISPRRADELDKLNDLIPQLERLVDDQTLSPTAAYQFACMSPEDQLKVAEALADHATKVTVAKAKQMREEFKQETEDLAETNKKNAATIAKLNAELALAKNRATELTAELAVLKQKKEGTRTAEDEARIQALLSEIAEADDIVGDLQAQLNEKDARIRHISTEAAQKEARIQHLENTNANSMLMQSQMARFITLASEIYSYGDLSEGARDLSELTYEGYMNAIKNLEEVLPRIKRNLEESRFGGVTIEQSSDSRATQQLPFPKHGLSQSNEETA